MENQINIIFYKQSCFNLELDVLGFPYIDNATKYNVSQMRAKNPDIYKENILIFMPTFSKYKAVFIDAIYDMYFFRSKYLHIKSIPILDFIYDLYFEYRAWLTILIEARNNNQSRWTTKDHLDFILNYNKRYYPHFLKNKIILNEIFYINPFIHYWCLCFPLLDVLDLPLESCFIPCGYYNDLDTLFKSFVRL